ncbi:hypothetical protein [Paenibacillus sp. NFR01]|uniref:hypothetical protein n=1 Tax=Paenibacillus sp. NFR01 TaxID=1566279 RepID=UPI0008B769BB|nr:hypothetical protein [Paenibacillus sp. NFR01]SET95127.1 hypothetical protein SAMN03159358_2832 [Paenibacillus sp. NFR01]
MQLFMFLIRFAFHLLVVWGMWLIVQPLLERHLRQLGQKLDHRMNRRLQRFERRAVSGRTRSWIYRHVDRLLYFAQRKYEPGISVLRFFLRTFLTAVGVYGSAWLTLKELPGHLSFSNPFLEGAALQGSSGAAGEWRLPLFLALLFGTVPYLRLRYKYAQRKVRGSYDLLDVIRIATKYTHLSVDSILARTAELLGEDNVLKTPLRLLGAAFSNYSSETELNREAERFARAIGTTFAVEFVSDLLYCEKEGTRYFKNSLMTLNQTMEQQRETIMNVKAGSRDAISLGLYGNLVVLVSSVGTFMFMLKPDVYFKLQFETSVGLIFLMIILSGLFISFLLSTVLAKPKLDYH